MSTTTEEVHALSDDEIAAVSGGSIDLFNGIVQGMYFVGLMIPELLTIIVQRARDDPWQN